MTDHIPQNRSYARPQNLKHFLERIAAHQNENYNDGTVLIVAFGDSVTMGATAGSVLEPQAVYHQRLKYALEQHYPQTVFSVINSGIGGDTVINAHQRMERDVIRHQPDLVLIAFGLNDADDKPESLAIFKTNLRQAIDNITAQTPADVILMTPNFMTLSDNPRVPQKYRPNLPDRFIYLQSAGWLERYAKAIKQVGAEAGCLVADVYARWQALADKGVDTTDLLSNGLNHPTGEAHKIAADCVMEIVKECAKAAKKQT